MKIQFSNLEFMNFEKVASTDLGCLDGSAWQDSWLETDALQGTTGIRKGTQGYQCVLQEWFLGFDYMRTLYPTFSRPVSCIFQLFICHLFILCLYDISIVYCVHCLMFIRVWCLLYFMFSFFYSQIRWLCYPREWNLLQPWTRSIIDRLKWIAQ